MFKSASSEIPDSYYQTEPSLVRPRSPTPRRTLYLSNLDDQKFLRFSIKYIYLYKKSVSVESLKSSLSRVLVDYYPLAGRLRTSAEDEGKFEVDCNGEGALFAEAFMDLTADQFLQASRRPNRSWRKFLYRLDSRNFLDIPPLVIQVTNLNCGGMILCTAINHCLCDGIGTSQFLQAWAHLTSKSDDVLPISPFHDRHLLSPSSIPNITFTHPEYTGTTPHHHEGINGIHFLEQMLKSQSLVPISVTFKPSHILNLRKHCVPSLKCTSFEALASHTWRSWIRSLIPPASLKVKLLFSVNVRKRMKPELPRGYYGNGFVLGCAETTVKELVGSNKNIHHGVKVVQEAKAVLTEEYVRSMIDYLEERRAKPDLSTSFVISQWAKLGLEDLDFGEGKPVHMGPLASEIYCLFLPIVGDLDAIRVLVSVPEKIAEKFEYYMKDIMGAEEEKEEEEEAREWHKKSFKLSSFMPCN
ncbi:alcohol acyltransferase 9-like [Telopea speciosissima]|uniref:alcohol acyltransferase 9-like n=1 Tax=Telopea speciosissima TaxID=54955 RepID=UPI001CC7193C|nr:alcohol acyltransferase 9-like [Telopea speciosissima]